MTREEHGRFVITCDRCNARLDLGPSNVMRHRARRSPSGWTTTGENRHLCALCSPGFATSSFIRRFGQIYPVIREEGGRAVIHCDRCPVRMDLGAAAIVMRHLRMPSAWMQDAPDHHLCPACTRRALAQMVNPRD